VQQASLAIVAELIAREEERFKGGPAALAKALEGG
jgi:hypothetical protein